jgi:exosortase
LLPLAAFAWAYATTFRGLAEAWENPQYSHGWLVPVFALILLWVRRDLLDASALSPSWVMGIPLLVAGIGMRLVGAYYHYVWLDPISLVPTVAGIWFLVGGWPAWRWGWPSIVFLAFMVPLPYRIAGAMSGPLQRGATIASTFLMQTLGLPALSEGNIILLNDATIGVVEACSGLRMMTVFFALAFGMAVLINRPMLDRVFLVASAAPIAMIANILRITATGVLHDTVDSQTANAFFHDFAGWLMMPMALGFLWIELKLLSALFVNPPPIPPRPPRDPARQQLREAGRRRRQQYKAQTASKVKQQEQAAPADQQEAQPAAASPAGTQPK